MGHASLPIIRDLVHRGVIVGVELTGREEDFECEACVLGRRDSFRSLGGDDWSRWTTCYLLKNKSSAFDAYRSFFAWVQTQFGTKIKCLHSDRGGEYRT